MAPTTNPEETLHSHTFVLTLWRERADGPWRAALRPSDGTPRLGFADMEQLVTFLIRLADPHISSPSTDMEES